MLLTLRSANLRAHSGQVAFPGGKIDAGETPAETALREAQEEIGLERALHRAARLARSLSDRHRLSRRAAGRAGRSRLHADDQPARGRRSLRDAARLPDGRRPIIGSKSASGRAKRESSTQCPTTGAISGARPPASSAISTRGCSPDVARRSPNRSACSSRRSRSSRLSRLARALSARGRALDARPGGDADPGRARRRASPASSALTLLAPRGQGVYVPAHVENGVLVPGHIE